MTILYDDMCFRQRFGGVPKCFCEIMRRFPADVRWRIAAYASDNEFLKDPPFSVRKWPFGFVRSWRGIGWRYENLKHRLKERLFAKMVQASGVDIVRLIVTHNSLFFLNVM